jgi:proline iminopeptidase
MEAGIAARAGELWYDDAVDALRTELAGTFLSGPELMDLSLRMFPFYFARYGDEERAYVEAIKGDEPCVEALRLWETEVFTSFDLRPLLPRLTMPTLVITGSEDFITGPRAAADLAAIPGAEGVILDDAGHMIFVDAPEQFREAVLSFLGVRAEA